MKKVKQQRLTCVIKYHVIQGLMQNPLPNKQKIIKKDQCEHLIRKFIKNRNVNSVILEKIQKRVIVYTPHKCRTRKMSRWIVQGHIGHTPMFTLRNVGLHYEIRVIMDYKQETSTCKSFDLQCVHLMINCLVHFAKKIEKKKAINTQ